MGTKKITKWEPEDFELEMTTHWSFPKRGDWATHDAKWRGNWSPYIPRNILLRYSKENDTELFLYFSYLGLTSDLRNVFTEVQISSLADKIYYIDGVLLQQYQNKESTIAFEDFPDPQHPEAMIDPIPVGIDISIATEAFQKVYTLHGTRAVIGICSTSERPETAFSFLLFSLGLS